MLKMPQQQYIKFLREIEGHNISEIANQLGVHWRTAKKYADKEDWNQTTVKKSRKSPVMEPYKEIIDTWLIEDSHLPRKQRHKNCRIFNRLQSEYGFPGGQRTVTAYVSKRRKELELEKAKSYQRLEHPGGEAQVDFTTIHVSKDCQLIQYKLLVMSFPFSNAAFVYPVPAENQECFLEGLKTLFGQIGGVPQRIWFDNLSAAVIEVKKDGERKLTDGFMRFVSHYRFEPIFCNPASGNEKGHVENKCGYGQRNWCVPVPVFESQEILAGQLANLADGDLERAHYLKDSTTRELWTQEQKKLQTLPCIAYEVFHLDSAVVNKYSEIRTDKVAVPVFQVTPGTEVMLKVWWDRVEVLNREYGHLTTIPRPYTGKTVEIPWHEVFKGFLRKPRSVNHSQFVRMLPEKTKEYISTSDLEERRQRLSAIVNWSSLYEIREIHQVLTHFDDVPGIAEISALLALKYGTGKRPTQSFAENYTPSELKGMGPDLSRYNSLAKGGDIKWS
jgi:transposase